jgi:hypothetical protein
MLPAFAPKRRDINPKLGCRLLQSRTLCDNAHNMLPLKILQSWSMCDWSKSRWGRVTDRMRQIVVRDDVRSSERSGVLQGVV